VADSRRAPQPLQRRSSPNSRVAPPTTSTASCPPPSRSAVSTDSVMRARCAPSSTNAIEDHRDGRSVPELRRRRRREVEDVVAHADAGEAPPREIRPELRRREPGRDRQANAIIARAPPCSSSSAVTMDWGECETAGAPQLGQWTRPTFREEQAQVVVDLGGGADGGARRPDRILLLERDGRTDLLDPVHVRPVDPSRNIRA